MFYYGMTAQCPAINNQDFPGMHDELDKAKESDTEV